MNLLEAAIEIATKGADVVDQTAVPMPEYRGTVELGRPSDAMKAAREKLSQNERDALSSLKERIEALTAQIAEEQQVIKDADVDAAKAIKAGTETRESLATKRANASISIELIADLEMQKADVRDQYDRERHRLGRIRDRLMGWAQNIEVATRSFQIDCIQGKDRLQIEKYGRAMSNLLSFRAYAIEHLGEELAAELEEAITTNPIPPTLVECLFENMATRDREKYAEHEPTTTIIESGETA